MKTADRLQVVQPFRVMEILDRAAAHERAGHDVVHLEVGEPDFSTCEAITNAGVSALQAGQTKYTSALGVPELRQAIARWYGTQGVEVEPDRVIVTAGASGGLMLLMAALLNPSEELLIADPGYPCNEGFVEVVGARARRVPVTAEQGFQPAWPSLTDAWGARTRGVLLASPANPTGAVLSAADLRAISTGVNERDGFLILDEIYQGLTYGEAEYPSALAVTADAIILQSFSKYFGMTGWRLGWVIVPDALLEGLTKLAQNLFICPSTVAQYAALAAFDESAMAEHERRRAAFQVRRDRLAQGLEQVGLTVPVTPQGAFYVYADVSASGIDSTTFCDRLLDEFYVAATPGADFGDHLAERFVRFSYTTGLDDIDRGLERIGRAVRSFRA